MLPQSYHKIFRKHLSEQQYLTLEILLLLIQAYRQVKLSKLASLFPQPIKYESRKRNLQRFLGINKLCVKLLWFPLIKYWIRQSLTPQQLNREQRRYFHKKQYQKYGYWMVALDRTQWKGRNIFMVTLVWGTHALPLYWETLNHVGNSNLSTQKRLIKTAIKLLKKCRIVVLADREFRFLRLFYGELIEKCQCNKLRKRKLLKLRNPYPSRLINLSLLLIPSTVPLVVLPSK